MTKPVLLVLLLAALVAAPTTASASASPSPSAWRTDRNMSTGSSGPMCVDCMPGMSMPTCPDPDACSSNTCAMNMLFSSDSTVCVLVDSWQVSTPLQWFGVGVAVFLFAFVRELLLVWRQMRVRSHKLEERVRRIVGSSSSSSSIATGVKSKAMSANTIANTTHHALLVNGGGKTAASGEGSFDGDDDDSDNYRVARGMGSLFAYVDGDDVASTAYDALIYMLTVAFAYLLMLVVMSYNVSLFFIVLFTTGASHVLASLLYTAWSRRASAHANSRIREHLASAGRPNGSTSAAASSSASSNTLITSASAVAFASDPCCADVEFDDE